MPVSPEQEAIVKTGKQSLVHIRPVTERPQNYFLLYVLLIFENAFLYIKMCYHKNGNLDEFMELWRTEK